MAATDAQVERSVDEVRTFGLDVVRAEHVEELFGCVDQAASVAAHVDDQTVARQLLGQPHELIDELVSIGHVKREDADVAVPPAPGAV